MKRIVCLFTITFLLCLSVNLNAQSSATYVSIEYLKVPDGLYGKYAELENDIWKPMHAQRVEEGEILGWYLYKCRYPDGTAKEYDYISMTVYADFTKMESPLSNSMALAGKAHPKKSIYQIKEQTHKSRKLVRGEIFQTLSQTIALSGSSPGKFLHVNFMKASKGQGSKYVRLEKQYWKTMHQVRIDDEAMNSWTLYGRVLPDGTNMPYDFITIDAFDSFESMMYNNNPQWNSPEIQAALPAGNTLDKIETETEQARDLVRRDLWELVNYVRKEHNLATSGK